MSIDSRLPTDRAGMQQWLDTHADYYNTPDFIADDPIRIPHQFNDLRDVEIMAFWTAILAWGRRQTIIDKAEQLIDLMEGQPFEFVVSHRPQQRQRFEHFRHRTFQPTDAIYFLEFLQHYYRRHDSLEHAFSRHLQPENEHVGPALRGFHEEFFALPDAPERTRKHIATPARRSCCKRLNMFLRWMVRKDDRGVDLGIWQQIRPAQLLMPLDVHVERVARQLGLIERKQADWLTVLELTRQLKTFSEADPVRYDFALFGAGVMGGK